MSVAQALRAKAFLPNFGQLARLLILTSTLLSLSAAVSPSLQCIESNCQFNYGVCINEAGCKYIIDCREGCLNHSSSKLIQMNCLNQCVVASPAGEFGAVLWNDVDSCFNVYCPTGTIYYISRISMGLRLEIQ